MASAPPSKASRIVVSLVILGALALQAQAVFPLRRIWPFLDYPMYRTAHYAGEALHRYRIVGITPGGREVDMDPASLGLSFFKHLHGPVEAIQERDHERLATYVEIYRERHGIDVVTMRLVDDPIEITRRRVVERPPVVVAELRVDGNGRHEDATPADEPGKIEHESQEDRRGNRERGADGGPRRLDEGGS